MTSGKGPKRVAVLARRGKTFGGGRRELRAALRQAGHDAPLWYELSRSGEAPDAIDEAMEEGADLVYAWGGDGLVQRCIDTLVDCALDVPLAILPAGTGNLLARHFEIPREVGPAVEIGLRGRRMPIDVGRINGECFAVMAGCGADAITMGSVSKASKRRLGALAYVRSGMRAVHEEPRQIRVRVDGKDWFEGLASCVLVGNIGEIQGGLRLFPRARPDDGVLEVAVVTARTQPEWLRVLARVASGHPDRSPFVQTTRAREKVRVKHTAPAAYELDGGARDPVKKLRVDVARRAVTLCVPK